MAAANNDAFFCRVKSAPRDMVYYIPAASKKQSAADKARGEARRNIEDIIEARNHSFKEVWEE